MLNFKKFLPKFLSIVLTIPLLFSFVSIFSQPNAYASSGFTSNDGIIYKDGSPIQLHGVNWFGGETDAHVQHGLWSRNWQDMIKQIKDVGFNALRIPFCPATMRGASVQSVNYTLNPDLANLNSQQIMDKILLELNSQGIYFLLDFHRIDCYQQSALWYSGDYSEDNWVNDLKYISNRYKNLGYFVGMDIKNEPKNPATWGTGNPSTDWDLASAKAGKAILSVNPNVLIFVQGITDNPTCSINSNALFWGENLQPAKCKPISTDSIPEDKLVFSPHVYGPDVYAQSYFFSGNYPNNMRSIWEEHFGSLTDKGYTLVPGEWGGKYGNGGDLKDVLWQNELVNYFKDKQICNSFYWDWNPNSTDTGGILKDDWTTVWSNKMDLLKSYYSSCQQKTTSSKPSNNIVNTTTNDRNLPVVDLIKVTSTPTITPSPTLSPAVPKTDIPNSNMSNLQCIVDFKISNKWNNGYTADVTIKNISNKKINNWILNWDMQNNQKIDYLWSGKYWANNNQVNVANEFWNGDIDVNASVSFGFNGSYTNEIVKPQQMKLNGTNCSVN